MTTVADVNDTGDRVVDYEGEEQEQALREDGDSRVVMMAGAGCSGRGRWQTLMAKAENESG
jgi:hypothetical protein